MKSRALACLALITVTRLHAQANPNAASGAPTWSVAITGGGSYALSDLEIVPGIDQNGGWAFDAGLRVRRGRVALGVGFEQLHFRTNFDGSTTASSVYAEPRFELSSAPSRISPYVFVHGGRVFDYDTSFCCDYYSSSSNGRGWIAGAGFGMVMAPMGPVRLDLSAGVHHVAGKAAREGQNQPWNSEGPMIDVRLGASIPVLRGRLGSK